MGKAQKRRGMSQAMRIKRRLYQKREIVLMDFFELAVSVCVF